MNLVYFSFGGGYLIIFFLNKYKNFEINGLSCY